MSPREHLPHTVYRVYDTDGVLVYVGCTSDIDRRLREHRSGAPWRHRIHRVTTVEYPDMARGLVAEHNAINAERPEHNIGGARWRTENCPARMCRWPCRVVQIGGRDVHIPAEADEAEYQAQDEELARLRWEVLVAAVNAIDLPRAAS